MANSSSHDGLSCTGFSLWGLVSAKLGPEMSVPQRRPFTLIRKVGILLPEGF